jgi:acetolactate synthase-1/2/3 large subunit
MKITDYIVEFLSRNGVDTIFGHIGGFNADIVDAIYAGKKQKFVLNYHEQAAAFAANAWALVRENLAVAISSGAPSSCNMIPGLANAFFDSIPCLFIAGSVHSKAVRESAKIRQNAFEEIDMVSLASGLTKFSAKVNNPLDIRFSLEKAVYLAREGRPGPVLLDIPYDVARSEVEAEKLKNFSPPEERSYDRIEAGKIVNILRKTKKPLLLLGGGARKSGSRLMLEKLLEKSAIPAVASLCGLDALPHDHPCFVGYIGHYGHRYANFALANCDCLIILGSRLDERQIAGDRGRFAPGATVIRVDIDPVELGRKMPEDMSIRSSVENFLQKMLEAEFGGLDYAKWHEVISLWKRRYPSHDPGLKEVNANNFLWAISDYLPENTVICADVGQNQMFTAQSLRLDKNRKLLNSAGYGSMGFSLPAAVGAAYGRKNTPILSINGDGGLQMNIQELQTLARDHLPVKVIVLNNKCLGMIRRLQERIFDDRTAASVDGYSVPNYEAIAAAYGLRYCKIDSADQYGSARDFLNGPSPALMEVFLPQKIMNNPEPGAAIDLQTPLLSQEENRLIKEESSL